MKMLIATTISEHVTVSFSVDVACGDEIAFQNVSQPPSVDLLTTSASGISTMMLRYAVAMPMPNGAPLARRPRVALAGSADTQLLLDLRDRAVLRVEELRADLVPAAELVDLEQVRRSRELRLVRELLQDRAVAVILVDLLRLLGEE